MYFSSRFRLSVNRVNLSFTSHPQCRRTAQEMDGNRSMHSRCLNCACLELYTASMLQANSLHISGALSREKPTPLNDCRRMNLTKFKLSSQNEFSILAQVKPSFVPTSFHRPIRHKPNQTQLVGKRR
jgi:hypothetical protein